MTTMESTKRQLVEEQGKVTRLEGSIRDHENNVSLVIALGRVLQETLVRVTQMEESLRQQLMGNRFTEKGWIEI